MDDLLHKLFCIQTSSRREARRFLLPAGQVYPGWSLVTLIRATFYSLAATSLSNTPRRAHDTGSMPRHLRKLNAFIFYRGKAGKKLQEK
jgi:hypothetical protein